MGWLELSLIAVGLSMDAFAVSICKGLNMKKGNFQNAGIIALFFGGFQAGMPLIGWLLGSQFERYISGVDHWIAFGLLALIGGKMIRDVYAGESCPRESGDVLNIRELFTLAVATSIDAFAVGITFALLGVSIVPSISLIGACTFALSFMGVVIGCKFGEKFKGKAELAGGIALIFIGAKILLEHLGVL